MALFVPHRPSVPTFRLLVLALSMLLGVLLPGTAVPPIDGTTASMALDLAALPLQFIPNIGQTDATVRFVAQHRESAVFFTANEVVLSLPAQAQQSHDHQRGNDRDSALSTLDSSVVRVQFDGANARPDIRGAAALPGRINYLKGKDPAQWRTDVPTYAGIVYQDLYAGIDLRYDGTMGRLKGTYTVAPGADPSLIRWRYAGATDVQLDAVTGALHISVPNRVQPLVERAPIVWQEQSGQQAPVTARYALQPDGSVGFALGAYDPALPLIIDPTLVYSTYLGGRQLDDIRGIAVDDAGNVYLTGATNSPDFPTVNALYPTIRGTSCGGRPCQDVFVTKLSRDGRTLLYSTYLGGRDIDAGEGITIDGAGNVYIAGQTSSPDFPTRNALQAQCGGVQCSDAFIAKLDARGSTLVYSTYLGGSAFDSGHAIAVDQGGNATLVGLTESANFPLRNPLKGSSSDLFDAFVAKLNAAGTSLVYSTYLGGSARESARDVALDSAGNTYIGGWTQSTDFPIRNGLQGTCTVNARQECMDAFITKLKGDGSTLLYSTYLGGSSEDVALSLAVERTGHMVVTGTTASTNFPIRNALRTVVAGFDAFVTKLAPAGNDLVYSTYLGGNGNDQARAVAVDRVGNAYVAGQTSSTDFPIKAALQATFGGAEDGFVTSLSPSGQSINYSTYLGGAPRVVNGVLEFEEAALSLDVDALGNAYVVGFTTATDFPSRHALQAQCVLDFGSCQDGFVTKIGSATIQSYLPVVSKTP